MAGFEKEYERLFGKGAALKDAGIEFVNYGVNSVGVVPALATTRWPAGGSVSARTRRMTWCPQQRAMVSTPIYDGPALPANAEIAGPAVIEHPGTTIVVLAGQTATIDDQRHTHIVIA
jgi:N-methylhydantoinase A